MSLSINHNLMAANTARNLDNHYNSLAVSVRRLSSGLRIGTAADDAAGLAIRELMRADVSAMNQGVRNVNDAVSLIQTADGALQVIDEKLIRMKELAEQAATGTYNSDQRLMIDSEYQAMALEISRIANATDFNGIHLLNGNAQAGYHDGTGLTSMGKIKIHFGTGNDSAEDYYYIQIDDCTAEGLSLGDKADFETSIEKLKKYAKDTFEASLRPLVDSGKLSQVDYDAILDTSKRLYQLVGGFGDPQDIDSFAWSYYDYFGGHVVRPSWEGWFIPSPYPSEGYALPPLEGNTDEERFASYLALEGDEKQKYNYLFARNEAMVRGHAYLNNPNWDNWEGWDGFTFPDSATRDIVGKATAQCYFWYADRHTYAGNNIRTQETSQMALDAISKAIAEKDKVRAHLGALQNRLENTISNLTIQAENLQAAESRISDVDVAQEMTEFTRQQIMTQSAVAMLSQANSLPQMALKLIQG